MRNLSNKNKKRIATLLLMVYMITTVLTGDYATVTAHALTLQKTFSVEEARTALQEIVVDREIMAVVYMTDKYSVKAEASYNSDTVIEVPVGQTVYIEDIAFDDDYEIWAYVSFYAGQQEYQGYISRSYLACSDERFLAWEEEYNAKIRANIPPVVYDNGVAENSYADIEQFPVSYQAALKALKAAHPTWVFVPMYTGLNWDTVITNQMGDKSLIYKTYPDHVKNGAYDNGNWFYATEGIVKYYMDPRNCLTEDAIFQFELLTYNETYHTLEALEKFLDNTFMKGDKYAPGTQMTYPFIIWAIGKEEIRKVSPFHLAARIYQEQGTGTSPLISGTYPGYEGLYNHFNVKASGKTTEEIIKNGLEYAKKANPQWNSAYYSILGGADIITANYIRKGQDTLYLQKYNVNPNSYHPLYTHQYMQNIVAPTSEAKTIRNLYKSANALESTFVFKIPVYENMPATAFPMPQASPYADIDEDAWYYEFVKYALDNGLMTGKGKTDKGQIIFEPNAPMTREQFVQVLYSNEGKPAVTYTNNFADVPEGEWFTDAIMWAKDTGIVAGKGEGFGVGDKITREEMATMLRQYAYLQGYDISGQAEITGYPDADTVSDWAVQNMKWAIYYGIITGKDVRIAPQENATRAEAATMLKRFIEAYE